MFIFLSRKQETKRLQLASRVVVVASCSSKQTTNAELLYRVSQIVGNDQIVPYYQTPNPRSLASANGIKNYPLLFDRFNVRGSMVIVPS